MTGVLKRRLLALWLFSVLWIFVPGGWLFNEIIVWLAIVAFWWLVCFAIAFGFLLWFHERYEDND